MSASDPREICLMKMESYYHHNEKQISPGEFFYLDFSYRFCYNFSVNMKTKVD